MKRYIQIILMLLLAVTVSAQNDPTPFHRMTMKAVPDGLVTMTVTISGYYYDAEGEQQRVYYYVNTDTIDIDYQVPTGCRISGYCYYRASNLSDWKLTRMLANGEEVATYDESRSFEVTMPDKDTDYVLELEYNPSKPGEPNPNSWNPETGELIIDNYDAGRPSNFNYNEDYPKVLRYILGGHLENNMYRLCDELRRMPNCIFFDFSRTDMETIGAKSSKGFKDLPLTEVVMPSTVKEIQDGQFSGTPLQVLTIFALMPPTLYVNHYWDDDGDGYNEYHEVGRQTVFPDHEGMVVRVPDEALPFYQEAEGWKDFTIVPMDGNFVHLTVNLLSSATDEQLALYKGMQLELTNVRTGQVRRLLVNGRNDYQFRYLPLNTVYSLTLRSATGYVVATLDNISLGEEDRTVTFGTLKQPHNLNLSVVAEGNAVDAAQYTTTWFYQGGEYLAKGNELQTVFEGQQVKYLVRLGRELAMQYQQPDTVSVTVGTATSLSLSLGQLPRTDVAFTVVDALTQQGIGGAIVSVTQLLSGGETGTIQTLTTDAQGVAKGNVIKSMSNITVSSDLYGSQTFQANLNDSTVFTVPFRQADGTQLLITYLYYPTVKEGAQRMQQSFTDLKNLRMVFQEIDGPWRYLTDYRDQNPRFTFYEALAEGTRIEVRAESLDGSTSDTYAYATVNADGNATVTLQLTQRGNICVGYRETAASGTGVMLFDGNGKLVQRKDFGQKYSMMYFEQLVGGNYTVVAMANMGQMKNITRLSQIDFLTEGKDYVKSSVYVQDGYEYDVYFDKVPQPSAFMPSNLKSGYAYANSSTLSVGDYVVVSVNAVFNDEVADKTENEKLVYQVPNNCDLVENSVRKDNENVSYNYNRWDRQLTVDWDEVGPNSRLRFCLIPTVPGSLETEARLTYTLNGEEHSDAIQTNVISATAASISVHELVVNPSVTIKGKAAPQAAVTVKDGNVQIARTTANYRGDWRVTALLADTTALSRHDISAEVVNNGVKYQTDTKSVTYDPNGIVAKKVTMSYFNYHPVHLENMEVVYDMENDIAIPSSYGFSNEPGYNTDFTFAIELNDNNPERVYAVALYVYTKGIETEPRALLAKYNEKKNIWVAYDKFNTNVLPYSVAVVPYYKQEPVGARAAFDQPIDDLEQDLNTHTHGELPLIEQLRTLLAQGETAYNNGNEAAIPYSEIRSVVKQLHELRGFSQSGSTQDTMDYDQLQKMVDDLLGPDFTPDDCLAIFNKKVNELGDLINGFQFTTAQGLTEASLLAEGYERIQLNDGSAIFILPAEDNSWTYVDLLRNLKFSLTAQAAARGRMPLRAGYDGENWDIAVEMIRNYAHDIQDYAGKIGDLAQGLLNSIPLWLETSEEAAYQLAQQMENGNLGWFKTQWIAFKYESVLEYNNTLIKLQEKLKHFKVGDAVGTLASIYAFVNDIISFANQFSKLNKMIGQVPSPCPDDQANADQILSEMKYFRAISIPYVLTTLAGDAVAVYSAILALQTAGAAPQIGAPTFLGAVTKIAASIIASKIYDKKLKANMEYFAVEIARLQCKKCNDPEKCCPQPSLPKGQGGSMASAAGGDNCCKNPRDCEPFPPLPAPPGGPDSEGILDPSGYVYEGVASNRLEGVTTTVYYKETVKDMYGDEHEQITLWDAENYAQENPQLTDENGEYGWDVPMGLWQVKYEKAGYETAYSEWLPVPPPQLDVNQALRQYANPIVNHVKATPEGVTVGFDKFMKPDALTADNIFVSRGGTVLSGTIELLDSEKEGQKTYASKLRFVPAQSLPAGQTLTLTVGGGVESYAGVTMGEDFQQEFYIEQAVERLEADSLLNVVYGENASITISALPSAAAAGKKVTVRLLSSIVASTNTSELTFDANGKADLMISGDMHGTTGIILQMADDPAVQTMIEVSVKDESDFILSMPMANHMTDTELYYGTAVELHHELADATIYYTLDGSCPCDLDRDGNTAGSHVFRYTEPIIVTADTKIKAMAVAKGFTESDVKELDYTVVRDSISTRMHKGWSWTSHSQMNDVPLTALGAQTDYALNTDGERVSQLKSATAYVVHNTESHDVALQGYAMNLTECNMQLNEGWNWMPYPLTVTLTPAEALAYADAQEGDVLVGEQGFAICRRGWSETSWNGTLKKLEPGKAYRYLSKNDKLFFMNGNLGGSTASTMEHPTAFRWYDEWAQPARMPILARLIGSDGWSVWDVENYEVVAFSGDECRGNGYWDNNYSVLFLNVLGQNGDPIRFTVRNKETDKTYDVVETLTFDSDLHGNYSEYMELHIGLEASAINGVTIDDSQHPDTYSMEGMKMSDGKKLRKGVYVRSGHKVVVK